jgi:hypothetical protein
LLALPPNALLLYFILQGSTERAVKGAELGCVFLFLQMADFTIRPYKRKHKPLDVDTNTILVTPSEELLLSSYPATSAGSFDGHVDAHVPMCAHIYTHIPLYFENVHTLCFCTLIAALRFTDSQNQPAETVSNKLRKHYSDSDIIPNSDNVDKADDENNTNDISSANDVNNNAAIPHHQEGSSSDTVQVKASINTSIVT